MTDYYNRTLTDRPLLDIVNNTAGVNRPTMYSAKESASVFIAHYAQKEMTARLYRLFEFDRPAKSAVESAAVFTHKLGRVNKKPTFMQSVYNLDAYYITAVHTDGRKKRTEIYSLMYHVCKRTLSRATTGQAQKIYNGRLTTEKTQAQDLILQAVACALYGYTDAKGKYHKGHFSDRVARVDDIMHTAYCAVNATLYANRITGRNTNKVACYGLDASTVNHTVVSIIGYCVNSSSVNIDRFSTFIDDIKKRTRRIASIKILDLLCNTDYYDSTGKFSVSRLTVELGYKSEKSVDRAVRDIKDSAQAVIDSYNMTIEQFAVYVTTA
jgi:hypothetical protein